MSHIHVVIIGDILATGNEEGLFSIIEESGVLYTTGVFDREVRGSYLLSIQARDSATANPLSSVVQVSWFVIKYVCNIFNSSCYCS